MVSRFTRSFIVSCFALLLIGSLFFLNPPIRVYKDAITNEWFSNDGVEPHHPSKETKEQVTRIGGVIMGKLGNETAKAQLGRATWKLLHTMTLRFPENPTEDEREALKSYFYLSSRLYPCGECAAEFQLLLKENPPQTSSRKAASLWLCHVHNLVNKRLGKDIFDCNMLGDTYDCGCGDDPVEPKKKVPPVDDVTGKTMIKGG